MCMQQMQLDPDALTFCSIICNMYHDGVETAVEWWNGRHILT